MHSFSSFSQLFHEDWRKGGEEKKRRREESNGRKVGVEEERTATDVKEEGKKSGENGEDMTDITGGRPSAPRASGNMQLCSTAHVGVLQFCARKSATVQNKRKHRFINIF